MAPTRGRAASRVYPIGIVMVVALVGLAFSPALRGPQLFDDVLAIQDNPTISRLWPASIPLHPRPGTAVSGRPVVNYTLALNYSLNNALGIDQRADPDGIDKTIGYHALNLVIHMLSGLVLFGLIRRTLRGRRFGDRWKYTADTAALAATAFWLLHPIQTEAVDYITQRTELLASLWLLTTLYCSIRAWDAATPGRVRAWYAGGIVACALGMGSKEIMVSAPLLVALYDRAFRADSWRQMFSTDFRGRRWFYAGLAATLAWLVILVAGNPRGIDVGFNSGVKWYEYLYTQGWAIAHYLRLVAWPTGFSLDYGSRLVTDSRGLAGLVLFGVAALLTIVAWTRANRWGWLAFLSTAFFLILAPSSSVIPIASEIAAERRIYLPLAAIVIALVVAGDALVRRSRNREWAGRALPLGTIALVLLLATITFQRSGLYRDPEAIWRDATVRVPENARAWNNLGFTMVNRRVPLQAAADSFFRKAVELDSTLVTAQENVAMSEFAHREYAAAERRFRRILALDPQHVNARASLATLLMARNDTTDALPYLEEIAKHPPSDRALINIGVVYLSRGRANEAANAFERAMAMADSSVTSIDFLGDVLIAHGYASRAIPYLEEAVRRAPASAASLALISLAEAETGRAADAVRAADRAVQSGGSDGDVYIIAARAMLAIRKYALAEADFARGVTLEPNNAAAITGLADADLALGKKAAAIELFDRALQITPGDSALRARVARLR